MSERRFPQFLPPSPLSLSLCVVAVASLSRIWLLATFMLSPTRTHTCLLSHSHVQWHAEAVAAFGSASLFKCPLGEANLLSPLADCAHFFPCLTPPLSLPSTPSTLLFRSLLMQFSIALPLFIYCLSMSLSICIVYFRWLMPTTTIRQTIWLSLSVYLSTPPFSLSLSLSLCWLLCFLHAKCSANSERAINSEAATERQAHKQEGTENEARCTQGG